MVLTWLGWYSTKLYMYLQLAYCCGLHKMCMYTSYNYCYDDWNHGMLLVIILLPPIQCVRVHKQCSSTHDIPRAWWGIMNWISKLLCTNENYKLCNHTVSTAKSTLKSFSYSSQMRSSVSYSYSHVCFESKTSYKGKILSVNEDQTFHPLERGNLSWSQY